MMRTIWDVSVEEFSQMKRHVRRHLSAPVSESQKLVHHKGIPEWRNMHLC